MSATGIGASVKRKEDIRFITGKGHYIDDINRPGQAHAYFLRSPHAHATINRIDISAAREGARRRRGLHRRRHRRRQGRRPDLRLDDPFQGRLADEGRRPSRARAGQGALCRRSRRRRHRRHLRCRRKDAAEKIVVDYGVLPAVVDTATTAKPGAPQVHDVAPNNTVYNWHLGDKAATDAAFAAAAHVTKLDLVNNRLIPNAMEPRAAVGEYDFGTDSLTLYTTSQNPHVARLVLSAFIGIAPEHKLRVIAPDVGGGFGSKIFIYAEETVCVWAAKKIDRPVKWTADRTEAFLSDAHGRDHVTHAELALDASGKITGLRVHTIANLGAYLSTFSSSVPTYLYAPLLSGQYNIPAIYCEVDAVYTNTAPVDAYRGAGPPGGDLRRRAHGRDRGARDSAAIPPSSAARTSSRPSRIRRRSSWPMTPAITAPRSTRRWRSPTTRASARARPPQPPRASCAASAFPPISRPAASRRRRRSARSAPASACGNRRRCASIRSAPSKC